VTQVLLDLTEPVGGASAFSEKMWPAALSAVAMPEGKVYYLPWIAGIRGAVLTVAQEHMSEAGIDYMGFETFDDVIEAGKTLTQTDSEGRMTRSGWSPYSSQWMLFLSYIWQLGGEFLDEANGTWSFGTDEAQAAAEYIYDMYWTHKTCDFDLFEDEYEAQGQGLISITGQGAWTASAMTDVNELPSDNIVTPPLAGAEEYVLYPDHIACWGLSQRLVEDKQKLQASLDFGLTITGPAGLVQAFEDYSGVCMSKEVYDDPGIQDVKYGPMSKRIAEAMWPVARYPQTYLAGYGDATDSLMRAMRQEITIPEALTEMEEALQDGEDAVRARLGI
jgi:ABC-type glycerol-3-phosphate transport system substrate-binding protein